MRAQAPCPPPRPPSSSAHFASAAHWAVTEPRCANQAYNLTNGDYVFNCNWDVMSNVTKSRQHGFQEVVDSEQMFVRLLRRFRAERIVP